MCLSLVLGRSLLCLKTSLLSISAWNILLSCDVASPDISNPDLFSWPKFPLLRRFCLVPKAFILLLTAGVPTADPATAAATAVATAGAVAAATALHRDEPHQPAGQARLPVLPQGAEEHPLLECAYQSLPQRDERE